MGVGNWSFRNTSFPQSNYSIDSSGVNYQQEREEALEAVKRHVQANPAVFEPFHGDFDLDDLDLEWFFANLESVTDELGLSHLNVPEETYVGDDSEQRYDELRQELQSRMAADPSISACWEWAETVGSGHNSEFRVAGEGRFVEIGIKQWETDYFVGVQPKYKFENYESAIRGSSYDPSTGKTEGSDPAMFLKVQQVIATAALVVEPNNEDFKALALITAVQADLDDVFGEAPSYRRTVNCVTESLLELAESSVENGDDAYFESRFGIAPQDFVDARPIVELVQSVFDEVGDLPQTIVAGYQQEFERADALVLAAMYEVSPEIMTPTGPWTSAKVNYVPPEDEARNEGLVEVEASVPSGPGM